LRTDAAKGFRNSLLDLAMYFSVIRTVNFCNLIIFSASNIVISYPIKSVLKMPDAAT